jgi:hypothetical protein
MNERLAKQCQLMHQLLGAAAAEVVSAEGYREYEDHISRNEFELALTALESLGERAIVGAEYWWNLKKAAEVMGLRSHYARLRRSRLVASRNAS